MGGFDLSPSEETFLLDFCYQIHRRCSESTGGDDRIQITLPAILVFSTVTLWWIPLVRAQQPMQAVDYNSDICVFLCGYRRSIHTEFFMTS